MKGGEVKYLIIFIGLVCVGCATDPWTKEQKVLYGTSLGLKAIDYGQTLDIASKPEKYYEINPIVGEHPSRGRVTSYFIGSTLMHTFISHVLPSKYRTAWLVSSVVVSAYLVNHNYSIGLRVNF